ncbi:polyphosphate kinase [Roseivivax halodurans JCM 10272]|uniref:Polyphosphate kinase n=1 Tax=Roseivivax halodurans JCM 10272 TaxID=1449350 RepID=X7EL59_9RHOB|nr:VOC family protein [Roseivivax halodurans]ETX16635.1 polyphosphate kinase [Roseivivax halodurans JCM 10272]
MLTLDHLAVAAESLEEATAHAEAALGQPMEPGGKHARYATHNRVVGLDGSLYLEAIAADPGAPPPAAPRWFGLDTFAGPARLDKWICRVPDIAAARAALPMAGEPVELSRGALRWTMLVPEDGRLPFDGLFPALIEWQSPVPPGNALAPTGWALDELTVAHPQAAELAELLGPHLADPRIAFLTEPVPALRARLSNGGRERILQ